MRKLLKFYRIAILFLITLIIPQNSPAFHSGGVAFCEGCHYTHYTKDGVPVISDANDKLLLNNNITDLCLSCHATEQGAVFGVNPKIPPPEIGAGNFTFLQEDNINDASDGASNPIDGNHAGHNVVSVAYNIPADPNNTVSQGGNYPASELNCISCHDPHGNDNYRMLRSVDQPDQFDFTFAFPAPQAEGIALSEQESPSNHTAYNADWSLWCKNCHMSIHTESLGGFVHPTDDLMETIYRDSYNQFNGSDDPSGGAYETAYIPDLPLEDQQKTTTGTNGAELSSKISCMSCHRAHATSAPKSLRWDPNVRYLNNDGLSSESYPIPNPYPASNQNALCVKCHYIDRGNHGTGRACMDCHRTVSTPTPTIE